MRRRPGVNGGLPLTSTLTVSTRRRPKKISAAPKRNRSYPVVLFVFAMSVAGIGVGVTLFAKLISENRPGLAVTGGGTPIRSGALVFVGAGRTHVPGRNHR